MVQGSATNGPTKHLSFIAGPAAPRMPIFSNRTFGVIKAARSIASPEAAKNSGCSRWLIETRRSDRVQHPIFVGLAAGGMSWPCCHPDLGIRAMPVHATSLRSSGGGTLCNTLTRTSRGLPAVSEVVTALPESGQPEGDRETCTKPSLKQVGGDPSCAPLPQQLEAGVAEIARHTAAPPTDLVPHAGNRSVKDKVLRSLK